MSKTTSLLFFHALSSLHAGAGQALGVIDNPIQREVHTTWPIIQSSSVKGVLRSAITNEFQDDIFGSDKSNSESWAGAISFGDARILVFPVRSLKGTFTWVTCPDVLNRFKRDCSLVGVSAEDFPIYPVALGEEDVALTKLSVLKDGSQVVFEEFSFNQTQDCTALAAFLSKNIFSDFAELTDFNQRFSVVSNTAFKHFVNHATEITTQISLDENKNTNGGALFYSENLPTETMLYTPLFATKSRKKESQHSADKLLSELKNSIKNEVLSFGAHETLGMGLCRLTFLEILK